MRPKDEVRRVIFSKLSERDLPATGKVKRGRFFFPSMSSAAAPSCLHEFCNDAQRYLLRCLGADV